jgi:hypothetical protein
LSRGVKGWARWRDLGLASLWCWPRGAKSAGEKARTRSRRGLACTHSDPGAGSHDGGVRAGLLSQLIGRVAGSCKDASAPGLAFSGAGAASSWVRIWKERASSRRAIATVAMLRPRRWASWP